MFASLRRAFSAAFFATLAISLFLLSILLTSFRRQNTIPYYALQWFLRKCGLFAQNCKNPLLQLDMSIKSLQTNCCIDIFYCSLFSLCGNHGILSVVIEMDINKKLIGKRIKHRREALGLSQEQLAEKLDLSTNHISSMECGKSLLTTKCLLALCDILGGTPDYYLVGEITPEADDITALVKQLSPTEQKMLCHLLSAYLANSE